MIKRASRQLNESILEITLLPYMLTYFSLAPAYIHAYLLTNIYIYAGVYVDNHAYAYTCV